MKRTLLPKLRAELGLVEVGNKVSEMKILFGLKFVLHLHLLGCGNINHEEDTAAKA